MPRDALPEPRSGRLSAGHATEPPRAAQPGARVRPPAVPDAPVPQQAAGSEPAWLEWPPVAQAASDERAPRWVAVLAPALPGQPQAGREASDGPVPPQAAGPDGLVQQRAAVGSAVRVRPAAVALGAARQRAAADGARRRAASDERARPVPAAASAFRPGQALPSAALGRRRAADFVHAMLRRRTASPSAQSWQAARDEALS